MSATASLLPLPRAVFYDQNAQPLAGGKVFTYIPNTLTPKTTWQDAGETLPNANPITLDANGSCLLYGSGAYQITVTDALGNQIPAYSGLTVDTLSPFADVVTDLLPPIANISALEAATSTSLPQTQCYVLGYSTTADGGEGIFVVGPTATANGGTIINDTSGRSWYRDTGAGIWSVKWFGATGDGTTDDTAAIQSSENAASTGTLGQSLFFPPGIYQINSTGIQKKGSVSWQGASAGSVALRLISGTPANGLVFGNDLDLFVVQDMSFDLTNGSGSETVLLFNGCSNYTVNRCDIHGVFMFGIGHDAGGNFTFSNNVITLTTAVNTQNQGIVVSTAGGVVVGGLIDNNVLTNTAMDIGGASITISNNYVENWKFGAGITTEVSVNCFDLAITNNTCINGAGTDVNATNCLGIENWAPRSVIIGNTCAGNAGDGIDCGGQNSTVVGNTCFNNGQIVGSGIVVRYTSSTVNGNYSTITGNNCFDSQISPTQLYGYSEQSSSVFGVFVSGNNFNANISGPMNVLGTTATTTPAFQVTGTASPGTVSNGSAATGTITAPEAKTGDVVTMSYSADTQGVKLFGWVPSNGTVSWHMENGTGGSVTIANGTLVAICTKPNGYVTY